MIANRRSMHAMFKLCWKGYAAASIVAVATGCFVLLAMGRIPFCKCGIVSLWSSDTQSNQQSQQFADPYTFTHIIHGALLYAVLWLVLGKRVPIGARFVVAVILESA